MAVITSAHRKTLAELWLPNGWRVHHCALACGRQLIEVFDPTTDLVGLVAATKRPMVSVAGAWRQFLSRTTRDPHWWTLAIGHANGIGPARVAFGRKSRFGPLHTFVSPTVSHGLWMAVVSGPQLTVRVEQGGHHHRQVVAACTRGAADRTDSADNGSSVGAVIRSAV
jgi:hypothetical protein